MQKNERKMHFSKRGDFAHHLRCLFPMKELQAKNVRTKPGRVPDNNKDFFVTSQLTIAAFNLTPILLMSILWVG